MDHAQRQALNDEVHARPADLLRSNCTISYIARLSDRSADEFVKRRLAPAVKTCRAISSRHDDISRRLERATQLHSTRVNIDRQLQNQVLLKSMNKRARMQLRLQATVEGLSVAAVTYYVVGLVYYCLRGLEQSGLPINPLVLTAWSVPLVAIAIYMGVRRIRQRLSHSG